MKHRARWVSLAGLGLLISALVLVPSLQPASAQTLSALKLTVIPSGNLLDILGNLVQRFLLIIGIVAFLYLVWAGFNYVTAGGDDSKVKASRSTILNVTLGILLIAVSYVLIQYLISQTSSLGDASQNPSAAPTVSSGAGNLDGNTNGASPASNSNTGTGSGTPSTTPSPWDGTIPSNNPSSGGGSTSTGPGSTNTNTDSCPDSTQNADGSCSDVNFPTTGGGSGATDSCPDSTQNADGTCSDANF
jgi:hypothetical protein